MTAGKSSVPITIRTMGGAGSGIGAQHCDQLEGWFAASPGLKVVQPSNPLEAYGLLTASIFDDDPVVFIEQSSLTGRPVRMPVPEPGTRVNAHVIRFWREFRDPVTGCDQDR
jgi:pyruvate dehydrogenase E1 component beta subunit